MNLSPRARSKPQLAEAVQASYEASATLLEAKVWTNLDTRLGAF